VGAVGQSLGTPEFDQFLSGAVLGRIAGWDLHPPQSAALSRRTPISLICLAEYYGPMEVGSRHSFSYRRLIQT